MKIVISAEELSSIITDAIMKTGVKISENPKIKLGLVGAGDETALLTEVIADINVEIR